MDLRHPRLRRCLVAASVLAAVAVPLSTEVVDAQTTPVDWGDLDTSELVDLGAPPSDPGTMTFLLGLDADRAALAAHAAAVSEPTSQQYGQHRSVAELAQTFGANMDTIDAVTGYFRSTFDVDAVVDPTRTYATVELSLTQAQSAFSTTWNVFGYPVTSPWNGLSFLAPTTPPTLPAALDGAVVAVEGAFVLDDGPDPTTGSVTPTPGVVAGGTAHRTGVAEGCAEIAPGAQPAGSAYGLAPNQLSTAYQLDQLHERGLRGQGMRVAVIDSSVYDPAWLDTYRSCFGLTGGAEIVDHVIGTPGSTATGMTETILDLSVLSFAAPEVERFDSFMVDTTPNSELDDMAAGMVQMFSAPLDAALTGGQAPDVISASFGMCEASNIYWQGRTAAVGIMENVFATAAAAGVTYVVSTGDSGSSGCMHNLGVQAEETAMLSTSYPSTSKWVTAVGGTNLTLHDDNTIASSGVWNDLQFGIDFDAQGGAGGGGTSQLIERPWYQRSGAVPGDATARVVPDISLFADELPGYLLFVPTADLSPGDPSGSPGWTIVGGTSAATPLFAGMALLLGQEANSRWQPTLGFANPLLYALAESGTSLLDITQGSNDMVPMWVDCCDATPGFDLATGWGSPLAARVSDELAAPTMNLVGVGSTDGSLTATFVVDAAPPAGRVTSYEWDVDGDSVTDHTTTEPVLRVTASAAGPRSVSVLALTSLGRVGAASAEATVTVPTARLPLTTATTPRRLAFVG